MANDVVVNFKAEMSEFNDRIRTTVEQLSRMAEIARNAEGIDQSSATGVREYAAAMRELETGLNNLAGNAFKELSGAAVSLTSSFVSSAATMEGYEARLRAVTKNADEARKALAYMAEFAATTPFDIENVVRAGTTIRTMGRSIEDVLPLAGKLAAATGRDIPTAALVLTKALNGSQYAINSLTNQFGISKDLLAQYGVSVSDAHKVMIRGAEGTEQFANAMRRLINDKFGTVLAEQAGTLNVSFSNLQDQLILLANAFGKELLPTAKEWVTSAREMLAVVGEIAPGNKKMIAEMVAATAPIAAVAAGLYKTGAAARVLSTDFLYLGVTVGAWGGILGLAAVGLAAYTAYLNELDQANLEIVRSQSSAATQVTNFMKVISASREELVKMGTSQEELAKAQNHAGQMLDLATERYQVASRKVDELTQRIDLLKRTQADPVLGFIGADLPEKIQAAEKELADWQKELDVASGSMQHFGTIWKNVLDAVKNGLGLDDEADKLKKHIEALEELNNRAGRNFDNKKKAGAFGSNLEEDKAELENKIKIMERFHEIYNSKDKSWQDGHKDEMERREAELAGLRKKVAEEDIKDQEKKIAKQLQLHEISYTQAADALKKLVPLQKGIIAYQQETEDRLNDKMRDNREKALQEQKAAQMKSLEATKQNAAEAAKVAIESLDTGASQVEVEKKVTAAIKEQAEAEIQLIKIRANKDAANTADPEVRKSIYVRAEEDIQKAHAKYTDTYVKGEDAINAKVREHLQLKLELLATEKDAADANIELYQHQIDKGQDSSKALLGEIEKRQQVEEKVAKTQLDIDKSKAKNSKDAADIQSKYDNEVQVRKIKNYLETEAKENELQKLALERHKEEMDLEKAEHEEKLRNLDIEEAMGKNVYTQKKKEIQDLFAVERKALQDAAAIEATGKGPEEKKRIERGLHIQINELIREEVKAVDTLNAAYGKGQKSLETQLGLIQSIDERLKALAGEDAAAEGEDFYSANATPQQKRDQERDKLIEQRRRAVTGAEEAKRRENAAQASAERDSKRSNRSSASGGLNDSAQPGDSSSSPANSDESVRAMRDLINAIDRSTKSQGKSSGPTSRSLTNNEVSSFAGWSFWDS